MRVRFLCKTCGRTIDYAVTDIPSPDWSGDTVDSSMNSNEEEFLCPYCEQSYRAEMFSNIYYGDLQLTDDNGEEIENFSLQEEDYENEDEEEEDEENTNASDQWLRDKVSTQYKDLEGYSCLDGHEGPLDLIKLFVDKGIIDTKQYIIHAFEILGFPNEDNTITISVYFKKRSLQNSEKDIDSQIEEKTVEVSVEDLKTYIKRFAVGFLIPSYLSNMDIES